MSGTRLGLSVTASEVASAPIGSASSPTNAAAATASVRRRGRGAPRAEPRGEADEERRQHEEQPALHQPIRVPGGEQADLEHRATTSARITASELRTAGSAGRVSASSTTAQSGAIPATSTSSPACSATCSRMRSGV